MSPGGARLQRGVAETGDRGGGWGWLWETLDRRVVCPAGKAAQGWPRVSARRHHQLSKRSGTGPWHGHRVWIEIRIPTPHFGHSLGLLAMRDRKSTRLNSSHLVIS